MNRSTVWMLLGALLLALVGCSKEHSTSVGPVTNDQQVQEKAGAPFVSEWGGLENADVTSAEPYIKTYPPPLKKGRLNSSILTDEPIVMNGGFEDGFTWWTTFVTYPGMYDYRVSPPVPHPEWAWIVGPSDPFGTNTVIYSFGMLHPESLVRPGSDGIAGASAVQNTGGIIHRLSQTITLPPSGTFTFEFWVRWKNKYSLGSGWVAFNQDIVVSLRDPATNGILAILFQAATFTPALPKFSGGGNITTAYYEKRTADITPFKGQTVKLEFETAARGGALFVDLDDIAILRVVTNQPPVANAGDKQTVECTSHDGANVTLDGSGSSDPDGDDPLTYTWKEGETVLATGTQPTASVTLSLGPHNITLTVEDGKGGKDTDEVFIEVVDTTPPVISSITATPNTLWPPNHKLVTVTVNVDASDNCGSFTSEIVSVVSSEPDNGLGDGDTADDIQNINGLTVQLRAERSGKGDGRIYTITVQCIDPTGNHTDKLVEVTVPGNKREKK